MPEEKVVFNQTVALDLFWLDGRAALHVVDLGTGFSNAMFLTGQSVSDVWRAFTMCWSSLYVGHPNSMRTDSGSVFTSDRWTKLTTDHGIDLRVSGIESHNSLGLGERYHSPLRRIFRKLKHEAPSLDNGLILRLATKAMNDTVGPEGYVPSLLVFGTLPRFPAVYSKLPDQKQRMEALSCARREYATIVSQLRVAQALRSKVPPAAKHIIVPGDRVFVFREGNKSFLGPFPVIRVSQKEVYVSQDNKLAHYNLSQVIPASKFTDNEVTQALHTQLSAFRSDHGFADRPQPKHSTQPTSEILITEIIPVGDARNSDPRFLPAKKKELEVLLKCGTWKVVCKEDVPPNANVIGGRFTLCIKNAETNNPLLKARFIAQGHLDKEKDTIVHNTTTLQQSSIGVLLALAALFGFRIWSTDITQAYVQSATELMRDIYIRPTKEFELGPDQLLKLLRPLYGLTDSGDYWNYTFQDHMVRDLQMEHAVSDLSLFTKHVKGRLKGLAGTYVDDSILAGTTGFMQTTSKTAKRFDSKKKVLDNFVFAGIEVSTTEGMFQVHQRKQIEKLDLLPLDATHREFKSKLMSMGWITHTRPDISCKVAQLAQVTENRFTEEHVKQLNSGIKYLKGTIDQGLSFKKLDLESLYIRVYTDAAFANNIDLTSQLGYIITLCDKHNVCNVLSFRSYKSQRVVRSVLGGEIYAFADGFDSAYLLKHDLERILKRTIRICILTDSKSLFDTITKNSIITEKRLMIDVSAARQAYQRMEISDVGHISSKYNAADGLTKTKPCPALIQLLSTGKMDHPINQWIIRNDQSLFN